MNKFSLLVTLLVLSMIASSSDAYAKSKSSFTPSFHSPLHYSVPVYPVTATSTTPKPPVYSSSDDQYYSPAAANNRAGSYKFDYSVKDEYSSNDYSHSQESDGKVVTGSYRVLLPDGRTQIVTYRADENGYVADVKYEGNVSEPEPSYYHSPSNSYETSPKIKSLY